MSYCHVILFESVLRVIRSEVSQSPKVETGGALVGYLTPENLLIITHACGPGPRAELRPASVLIDGRHAGRFCTDLYKRSNGRLDYVGDWHKHPAWSPLRASDQDLSAMMTIKDSNCCSVPFPVSLIYRPFPERLVIFALSGESLHPVTMTLIRRDATPQIREKSFLK
jgi:integrative and conjugative element protein (TIGR02256 family)